LRNLIEGLTNMGLAFKGFCSRFIASRILAPRRDDFKSREEIMDTFRRELSTLTKIYLGCLCGFGGLDAYGVLKN